MSGPDWSALGGSGNGAINIYVRAVVVSGPDVYVGGDFTNAAGIPEADYVAHWNGSAWSALGSNGSGDGALNARVRALAFVGKDLYAAGDFFNSGGPLMDQIARWNGSTWSALGSNGAGDGAINDTVFALAVSGKNLYVGGEFDNAGGIATADFVARWNGSSWSALGSNGSGNGALNNSVYSLAASGSNVYPGGAFTNAGNLATADYVARWNGSAWSALGSNGSGDGALNAYATSIAIAGSNVYVGGVFTDAANLLTADYIARWNGSAWSNLGSNGSDGAITDEVDAIAIAGSNVYVGGRFTDADNIATADRIALWSGSAWSALGSDGAGDGALNDRVYAVAVSCRDLLVGGEFLDAAAIPEADYVARYGPISSCRPDGRVKKGSGSLVGNNIYNTDGTNQTVTGSAAIGSTITFTISIQNDGPAPDLFKVAATGAAAANYQVTYFKGTTNITAAIVAGTYQTSSVAAGKTVAIKARVKVLSGATTGSSVTRLVTITSSTDTSAVDAVKFIGKRS